MNKINNNIYDNLSLLPIDIQGWNGLSKIFHVLIEETKPSLIIEVGTWKGQSAINMANFCKENNMNTKIWCVDTWLGALEFWGEFKNSKERNLLLKNGYPQIYYQFISNVVLSGVKDYIVPFPTTSLIGARYFRENNIKSKLIYIDASHEYEDVKMDINEYYKLLDNGGIIFGDDYESWIGVKKSVNEFVETNNLKDRLTIYENNFWVIRK